MSHSIHTTHGLIVASRQYHEAGKVLSIFTRELGLVFAIAEGIRLEKSKLRAFIQDYSFGIFSLVRGKELWRLTSAQELPAVQEHSVASEGEVSRMNDFFARVSLLLKRFVPTQEPHPELFIESQNFIEMNASMTDDQMKSLESLLVFRMMRALGYIGTEVLLAEYSDTAKLSLELLTSLGSKRVLMNQHINKALKESHL